MDAQLFSRRSECLRYHAMGLAPSDFTREVGQRFGCSPGAVWRDWDRRDGWMKEFEQANSRDALLYGCLIDNLEVKRCAWQLFRAAGSVSEKLRALQLVAEMNTRIPELGFTYLKAEELAQEIRVKWDLGNDKTVRVVAPWHSKISPEKDVQTLLKEYDALFRNADSNSTADGKSVSMNLSDEESQILARASEIVARHKHDQPEEEKLH